MRALISVSDKTGIVEFAKELNLLGIEIISTGGTHKTLEEAGVPVIGISDVTGFPECLDGRVKTLHPNIHAGLLAIRNNEEHMKQVRELNVELIDLVVVNLYPFKETILKDNVTREEAIENILDYVDSYENKKDVMGWFYWFCCENNFGTKELQVISSNEKINNCKINDYKTFFVTNEVAGYSQDLFKKY